MRISVIVAAVLLITSLIAPLIQIGNSETYPVIFPSMYIDTPKSYQETIYQSSPSRIQVYAHTSRTSVQCVDMFYSVDGSPNRTLSFSTNVNPQLVEILNYGWGVLDNLIFGFHTINAYSTFSNGSVLSSSVTFFVNATSSNPLLLISPQNIIYNSTEVPIVCVIDDQLGIEYSLDGASFISSAGNSSLTDLSGGQHNLTVKAVSAYGTYSEQTVNFTIKKENNNLLTTVVITAIAIATGSILGVILLKRKLTKTSNLSF